MSSTFLTDAQLQAAATAAPGRTRRRMDTAGNDDSEAGLIRRATLLNLKANCAQAQELRFLWSAVFLVITLPETSTLLLAVLAAGKAYGAVAQQTPGKKHGSPHRQIWKAAVDAAVRLAEAKRHSSHTVLAARQALLVSPDVVSSFVTQFWRKAWGSNNELKKKNPQHVPMHNLHIAATPHGSEAVTDFALLAKEVEGAEIQDGTAPPKKQERDMQDMIDALQKQRQ